MYKDRLSLQFQGFHPADFTHSYLEDVMEELQREAPHGATLRGNFSRKDHFFKGMIAIQSPAGRFFAQASGTKLKVVTHELMQQIRRQLERWKSDQAKGRRGHRALPQIPPEASAS